MFAAAAAFGTFGAAAAAAAAFGTFGAAAFKIAVFRLDAVCFPQRVEKFSSLLPTVDLENSATAPVANRLVVCCNERQQHEHERDDEANHHAAKSSHLEHLMRSGVLIQNFLLATRRKLSCETAKNKGGSIAPVG